MSGRNPQGSGRQSRLSGRRGTPRGDQLTAQRRQRQAAEERREQLAADLGIEEDLVRLSGRQRGTTTTVSDEGLEAAEESFAEDAEFFGPDDVEAEQTDAGVDVAPTDAGRERARERQAEQLREQAASESDRFSADDFRAEITSDEINVEVRDSAVERERREARSEARSEGRREAAREFDSELDDINVTPDNIVLSGGEARLEDDLAREIEDRSEAEARREFAAAIESGEAFDVGDGETNPAEFVGGDIDPQEDIVVDGDSLELADSVQDEIESGFEQQARREFEQALESGAALEGSNSPVEPENIFEDVDPNQDITVTDDGSLSLTDEAQDRAAANQIRAQIGEFDPAEAVGSERVQDRALGTARGEAIEAVEEEILPEGAEVIDTPDTKVLDSDVYLDRIDLSGVDDEDIQEALGVSESAAESFGRVDADRLLEELGEGEDFRDVRRVDVKDTETFRAAIAESIEEQFAAEQSISAEDVTVGERADSFEVESDALTGFDISDGDIADGELTDAGEDALAARELASIGEESDIPVDLATPIDNTEFANVSADVGQTLETGIVSNQTDVVAASDALNTLGDIDDTPITEIVSGLDPDYAARELGLDVGEIEAAQAAIEERRELVQNDPSAVLDDISASSDEFVEDMTRLETAQDIGRARRSTFREEINQLEADIAARDPDVSEREVGISLNLRNDSGIRDINEAGRRAIRTDVASDLEDFTADDINVSVDDGEIASEVEPEAIETRAREDIASSAEGVDREDVRVELGDDNSIETARFSEEFIAEQRQDVAAEAGVDPGRVEIEQDFDDGLRLDAEVSAPQQPESTQPTRSGAIGGVDLSAIDPTIGPGLDLSAGDSVDLGRFGSVTPATGDGVSDFGSVTASPGVDDPLRDRGGESPVEQIQESFAAGSRDLQEPLRDIGRDAGSLLADVSLAPAIEEAATGGDSIETGFEAGGASAFGALDPIGAINTGIEIGETALFGPDGAERRDFTGRATAPADVDDPFDEPTFEEELAADLENNPAETIGSGVGVVAGAALTGIGAGAVSRAGRRPLTPDVGIDDVTPDTSIRDDIAEFRRSERGQADLTGIERRVGDEADESVDAGRDFRVDTGRRSVEFDDEPFAGSSPVPDDAARQQRLSSAFDIAENAPRTDLREFAEFEPIDAGAPAIDSGLAGGVAGGVGAGTRPVAGDGIDVGVDTDVGATTRSPSLTGEQTPRTQQTLFEIDAFGDVDGRTETRTDSLFGGIDTRAATRPELQLGVASDADVGVGVEAAPGVGTGVRLSPGSAADVERRTLPAVDTALRAGVDTALDVDTALRTDTALDIGTRTSTAEVAQTTTAQTGRTGRTSQTPFDPDIPDIPDRRQDFERDSRNRQPAFDEDIIEFGVDPLGEIDDDLSGAFDDTF